jgi:hypothetical protein|tara:strand:+ start:27 stop:953 length:927 start_codon:yes stop_codon:yes gene_type:complete
MALSHKYRTFDQLLNDVTIDFSSYALEGMIEPQQLIKVATRVNYDLGLRINRTKDNIVDVTHSKGKLPTDFQYLNYALVCGDYKVNNTAPSGTHIDTTQPKYIPAPDGGDIGPCDDSTCKDVCVVKTCPETTTDKRGNSTTTYQDEYMVIQYVGAEEYRTYTRFFPLTIRAGSSVQCDCPNINQKAINIAEIKDGYLLTSFATGKVYINYLGAMEDEDGNLLVLDHPYCNEYYEYALKQRILENMLFAGENVSQQLGLIEQKFRAARNNALGFINTPDFKEVQKIWEVNRKAQYHNYYDMFRSHAPNR